MSDNNYAMLDLNFINFVAGLTDIKIIFRKFF